LRSLKRGFTLIEMLIVVVIMGILMGLVFKMMAFATRQAATADTVATLESVANAITEFRAEYGQYPPCDCVEYVYEDLRQQDQNIKLYLDGDVTNEVFRYGLISYLYPRDVPSMDPELPDFRHTTYERWIPDTERDLAVKSRWASLLPAFSELPTVDPEDRSCSISGFGASYTNAGKWIEDAWEECIRYESDAPYMSYRLWSVGQDRTDGTSDDIHKQGWDEQGN